MHGAGRPIAGMTSARSRNDAVKQVFENK